MFKNHLLKVKVSKLFYQNKFSKVEIAGKLRMSRIRVSNLIETAEKEGIVKIIINEVKSSYVELENSLEEHFKIYRAVVVEKSVDDLNTKKSIGIAAADCLLDMVQNNDFIGVAWGTTILEMVNSLPKFIKKKNISVVQLTGGSNQIPNNINASELTRRMSEIFNSKSYYLHAPIILNTEEARNILVSEKDIKNTMDVFNKINIAIVGIGCIAPEPSTKLYKDGFIKKEDLESILNSSAVGDINSYFYDLEGKNCKTFLSNKVIGIDLMQLRRIRYVIGLAHGEKKLDAIYGALKGRIINLIVTDNETAEELLIKANSREEQPPKIELKDSIY